MSISNKYFWYGVDLAIFAGLNVFFIWKLGGRFSAVRVGWVGLVIFGLAVYRLANIISNEQVTKPLREPFVDEKSDHGKIVEVPKRKGFLGAVGSLIYCPSCTGTWIAAVLVYSFVMWPNPVKIIGLIFALSAIERIIAIFNGWLKK